MPTQAAASSETADSGLVPNQLAALVPSFDPSKDDITEHSKKVQLLLGMWPEKRWTELATRLILGTQGSAFQKLQLHSSSITVNEKKSIHKIVELLGGQWGQVPLEQRYEAAEKALFRCTQKGDESHDSYLARADVLWQELLAKKFDISDLQAYITLRGSALSADDKKRVLLDCETGDKGVLTLDRVQKAIRMLGAGFFHEVVAGKRSSKLKTYDQQALIAEGSEDDDMSAQPALSLEHMLDESDFVDTMVGEGDEDAALIQDFESAAAEVLQSDPELATAYSAYTEARRRLSEKARSRGFWPQSSHGGKGKAKFQPRGAKGKFQKGGHRKSLQQRILESQCRICHKFGHWKAECPQRHNPPNASSNSQVPTASTSLVQAQTGQDVMPLEFMKLPMQGAIESHQQLLPHMPMVECDTYHVINMEYVIDAAKSRLSCSLQKWTHKNMPQQFRTTKRAESPNEDDPSHAPTESFEPTFFAAQGSFGIVDLGATKTVIGSKLVRELLDNLQPAIREKVTRTPCQINFRFGNHGILQSQQALVVPIHGFLLKIAVVPGSTPFLLSNTLLRAIGSVIDTSEHTIFAKKIQKTLPIRLTSKGLFLLDLNDLASSQTEAAVAETHITSDDQTQNFSEVQNKQQKCHAEPDPIVSSKVHHNQDSHTCTEQCLTSHHGRLDPPNATVLQDKSLPESFRVPTRRSTADHVVVPAPAAGSGQDSFRDEPGQVQGSLHSGTSGGTHSVRENTSWPDVSDHVGIGTRVLSVVPPALRTQPEGEPSEIRVLPVDADRTGRGSRHSSPSVIPRDLQQPEHLEGHQQDQGQGQGSDRCSRDSDQRLGGGRVRSRSHSSSRERCDSSGSPHAQSGECPSTSHPAPRAEQLRAGPRSECPSETWITAAGDVSADCHITEGCEAHSNAERSRFHKLVRQYEQELQSIPRTQQKLPRLDLLEVFCSSDSQLTSQCRALGYQAERFGFDQGDLQTVEGRRKLFEILIQRNPKNVWLSPNCGPWGPWSFFNSSRSLEAWDQMQQKRWIHLEQVALCVVVTRYQRQQLCHVHWEQPQKSLMLRLPYLQEIYHYMLAFDVDLCTAGDLRDPTSGKHIRKTLTILTTVSDFAEHMSQLRCRGDHSHEQIAGTTNVQGHSISRSRFTERYPRRFARTVARLLCRVKVAKMRPHHSDHIAVTEAECHVAKSKQPSSPSAPAPKRPRVSTAKFPLTRTREVHDLPWGKRQKCTSKTTPVNLRETWQTIFDQVSALTPRVGKHVLKDSQIIQQIQELVGKHVHEVISCKGSSRTIAPSKNISPEIAPFRRSVFTERGTSLIKAEEEWENWTHLAQRQLVRPSHPSHLNITIFASDNMSAESPVRSSSVPSTSAAAPNSDVPCPVQEGEAPIAPPTRAPDEPVAEDNSQPDMTLTPSQNSDLRNPSQNAKFRNLSKDEQMALIRAHKNLGHPSPERLSTILRQQGYRAEIAQAALEFKCSVCMSQVQPKIARPATIRDETDFNDRICMDGLKWTNSNGTTFHLYHIVDWATRFQAACIAPARSSEAAIQQVINMWFQWAGAPSEMLVDAATELNSDEFSNFAQRYNIKLTTISTEAPFQDGKAERHGDILKSMRSKFDQEHAIESYHDLQQALWWCVQAKNACSLRKGYAPEVLVLGKHTRLPGAVCSDESLPAHLLADSDTAHGIQFRQ